MKVLFTRGLLLSRVKAPQGLDGIYYHLTIIVYHFKFNAFHFTGVGWRGPTSSSLNSERVSGKVSSAPPVARCGPVSTSSGHAVTLW